jgi:histone H3/H4
MSNEISKGAARKIIKKVADKNTLISDASCIELAQELNRAGDKIAIEAVRLANKNDRVTISECTVRAAVESLSKLRF